MNELLDITREITANVISDKYYQLSSAKIEYMSCTNHIAIVINSHPCMWIERKGIVLHVMAFTPMGYCKQQDYEDLTSAVSFGIRIFLGLRK